MSKVGIKAAEKAARSGQGSALPQQTALSEEDRSKDAFFVRIAEVAEAMIARHGKEFAMGTLVLSARFIAESKPLMNRNIGVGEKGDPVKPT